MEKNKFKDFEDERFKAITQEIIEDEFMLVVTEKRAKSAESCFLTSALPQSNSHSEQTTSRKPFILLKLRGRQKQVLYFSSQEEVEMKSDLTERKKRISSTVF
jgi:hypothetical protein